METPLFKAYVNNSKNDIANWIETEFSNKQLSEKLRITQEQELTITILENFIKEKKKNTQETNISVIAEKKEPSIIIEPAKKDMMANPVIDHKTNKTSILKIIKDKIRNITRKKPSIEQEKNNDVKENKNDVYTEDEEYIPEFIKTGVTGFDELITRGIPKGSSVLLCGGAGTGKTTFSLQILNNWAKNQKRCLYLTFEEDISRLKSHMKDYGWDPSKLEREGYLKIRKMDPFEISRSVEALLAKASGELIIDLDEIDGILPKGFRPEIIVLDSLSAVSAAFVGKEDGYRIYVEQLFNMFKNIEATSFLISEVEENTNKYTRTGIEEFLADAVIVFYSLRQKSVRVNALEIIKVRGTAHQKKIVPFKMITGQGIVVFPKEDPFIE